MHLHMSYYKAQQDGTALYDTSSKITSLSQAAHLVGSMRCPEAQMTQPKGAKLKDLDLRHATECTTRRAHDTGTPAVSNTVHWQIC
jgi:hypothetical protein